MSVDLVPEWTIGDLCLTSYPFGVDADSTVDIGEPAMVVESVTSLLADGDLERVVRHGNRTYVLELYAEGPSLAELASAEATLRDELRRPGLLLTHDPGDGFSPASVYEVQTAQLTPERKDDHESHLIRKFTLTLTCGPFARSAEPVTVEALVVGAGSPTVVDTCNSATGWSATVNGVSVAPDMSWSPGAVSVKELLNPAPQTLTLTRTGAVSFSSTPYLVAEIGYNGSLGVLPVACVANGVALPAPAIRLIEPGWYEYTWTVGATSVSTLTFSSYTPSEFADLKIRNLARSGSPSSLPRQITRVIEAGGTERTPGSIHIEAASEATGLVQAIVHTCPEDGSGYSPPLRQWRYAGQTVIPDNGDLFSGSLENITGAGVGFDIPTSALPEGGYVLAANMRRSSEGSVGIAWSTSTIFPGGTIEEGFSNALEQVVFPDTDWHIVPLATVSLPSVRTKAGTVRVIIQAPTTGGPTTYLDEAWLFRVGDDCALTIVRTTFQHLWLNSAGVDAPVPTVWVGDGEDVRVHPGTGLQAMGTHVLSPGGTAVFTGVPSGDNPATEATFYPRWHSNAAS